MVKPNPSPVCLNCERTEFEAPLLEFRFRDRGDWICSQCLPILIHRPHELAGKLAGSENLVASDGEDHD